MTSKDRRDDEEENKLDLSEEDIAKGFLAFTLGKAIADELQKTERKKPNQEKKEEKAEKRKNQEKKTEKAEKRNFEKLRAHPVIVSGTILMAAIMAARFIMSEPKPETIVAVVAFISLFGVIHLYNKIRKSDEESRD